MKPALCIDCGELLYDERRLRCESCDPEEPDEEREARQAEQDAYDWHVDAALSVAERDDDMGDRANVAVKHSETETVWLYSHWTGHRLWESLRDALRRGRDRWDDAPYLTRIIFCQMIHDGGGALTDTIGFGISCSMTDSEWPVMLVDIEAEAVVVGSESIPFREFCGLEVDPRKR